LSSAVDSVGHIISKKTGETEGERPTVRVRYGARPLGRSHLHVRSTGHTGKVRGEAGEVAGERHGVARASCSGAAQRG
jgi:hypothetical protein